MDDYSSTAFSSSRASSSGGAAGATWVKAKMVEMELNAARALAGMAGFTAAAADVVGARASKSSGSTFLGVGDQQGSFHPLPEVRLNLELACPNSYYNELKGGVTKDKAQAQLNVHLESEIAKLSKCHLGSQCSSSAGGKSKQNLTEADKEAKRQRRVLANRESARQTILRRQAVRDELIRRVAHLSLENKNMKREKELALEEYHSLQETNAELKVQIARIAIAEAERSYAMTTPTANSWISSCSLPCSVGYCRPLALSEQGTGGKGKQVVLEPHCQFLPSTMLACSQMSMATPFMGAQDKMVNGYTEESQARLFSAAAAAEARKKRKEITKLKHIHPHGK